MTEPKIVTATDECIAELTQLIAQVAGGQIGLDAEAYPHLAAHLQRMTGKGPILILTAPAAKPKAGGQEGENDE